MKKTLLVLSALLLLSLQAAVAQVETTFAASADEEFARNIVRTADGGYIMAGWADEPGSTNYRDLFMLKCDVDGVQQWVKYYGKPNKREMLYRGLVTVGNSGYLIAGNRNSPSDRGAFLVRTNTNGDTTWTKTIPIPGSILVIINDARALADGFVVTGSTVETGGSVDDKKMILFKTDLNGNLLWLRTYTAGQGNALYVTSGGSFVVVGFDKIWRIRNNGDLAWERTVTFSVPGFPGTPHVVLRDIAESNSALIFSGFFTLDVPGTSVTDTLSGLLALRYTSGGSQVWLKRYQTGLKIADNHYAEGATMLFNNGGQYLLTGTVNGRIKVLRLTANGTLITTTNIGSLEVNAPTLIKDGTFYAIVAQSTDEPTDTYFYRTAGNALNAIQSDQPPVQETDQLSAERGAPDAGLQFEQLFPNPASDRISLDFVSETSGAQSWSVFNNQGKMVMQGVWEYSAGASRQNIDLSRLSAGLYALQFGGQSLMFVKE